MKKLGDDDSHAVVALKLAATISRGFATELQKRKEDAKEIYCLATKLPCLFLSCRVLFAGIMHSSAIPDMQHAT
jgi:hypothetical protein